MPVITGQDLNGNFQELYLKNNALPVVNNSFVSSATLTRPSDTDAYTALDVLSTSTSSPTVLTFSNVGSAGSEILISSVNFKVDVNSVPSGMSTFRLHLYNASPTAINDNAAYTLASGDRTKYLGWVDIPTPTDLGDTLFSQNENIGKIVKLAAGSTSLYGILQTMTGFTPSSGCVKKITLYTVEV